MAEQTIAEKAEQWPEIAAQFVDGFLKRLGDYELAKNGEAVLTEGAGTAVGIVMRMMAPIGIGLAKGMTSAENVVAPAFAEMAAAAVRDLFGTSVDASAFSSTGNRGGRGSAANALGRGLIDQIKGGATNLQPSDEAASKYLTVVTQMALEDWFRGWLFEVLSSLTPYIDVGKIENFASLGDKVAGVLGLDRLTRRVLSPIVDASIVTPLRWQVEKTYRPQLLSAGETARQVARGRWTRDQGVEELARQGYSADRIEAIFNTQRKFFSAGDVRTFVSRQYWTNDQGIQHLKDNGYEHQAALDALRLEGVRRIEQLEDAQAAAILGAYQNWEINAAQMRGLLGAAVTVPAERNLLELLAETRRELGRPRLSLSQVEAMVKSGVLSVIDYRNRARAFGYPEEDVMALELQLRVEMDTARTAAEHRAEVEAARAIEREAKAAAAAARKLEIDAERARQRRGPIGKLERAAVRGLIPIARVEELWRAEYDGDTVAILVDLVEADRQTYLEHQERAAAAGQRVAQRGLNLGELTAAVMENILTLQEFTARVRDLGLDAGDAEILAATLAARKADRDAAEQLRAAAAGVAARRSIDLPRFEALVRKGARTIGQYGALLAELGFDEPDQVDMVDLLQLKIAEDAAARDARDRAAATLTERGLSLDQFERAVVLGVQSMDAYKSFIASEGFTADAQITLAALLRDRVQEADAARARRAAALAPSGARALSIATVRRAARLGVISPTAYADRLARDGYALEDIELDVELLLQEIADVQARRDARGDNDPEPTGPKLSLAQVERAVRRDLVPIDDYRAAAAALGYAAADVELLVALLADELDEQQAARDRRAEIADELAARELSLGQLEEAVTKGFKSLDEFYAEIRALGYAADDAELLTALLAVDLEAAALTGAGGAA